MLTLTDLPNELLTHILSYLPSSTLLSLISLSRRINTLIQHLLLRRLQIAFTSTDHHLIFECYSPRETFDAWTHCRYLGSWPITQSASTSTSTPTTTPPTSQTITSSLYSHFLPIVHHAWPTSNDIDGWGGNEEAEADASESTLVPATLTVLPTASSTPLTVQSSLVKVTPKFDFFTSVVDVFEEKDIDVDRSWLYRAEARTNEVFGTSGKIFLPNCTSAHHCHKATGNCLIEGEYVDPDPDRTLWVSNENKNTAILLRVRERPFPTEADVGPLIMMYAEKDPTLFTIYYERLMIKTVGLLIALDRSWEEQLAMEGVGGMAVVLDGRRSSGGDGDREEEVTTQDEGMAADILMPENI